jgi:hypothetical protein
VGGGEMERAKNILGVCGDNCSCCPRYIATQERNLEELEKVKELWVRLGLRDIHFPVHDMACSGCTRQNTCAYSEVRACAYGKEIENCGLCHTYPCELIRTVFEKSKNLQFQATRVCTSAEIDTLCKTFFSKQKNLDQIHSKNE